MVTCLLSSDIILSATRLPCRWQLTRPFVLRPSFTAGLPFSRTGGGRHSKSSVEIEKTAIRIVENSTDTRFDFDAQLCRLSPQGE
jgi:hypothetical protein